MWVDVSSGSWSKSGSVRLQSGGEESVDFELLPATEGAAAANIAPLLARTGLITFDPGFANTAACASEITYIDGDAGILRYRGYPIEELAEHSTFAEVSYLLVYGELPTDAQLADFERQVREQAALPQNLKPLFNGFPKQAHPMAAVSSAVSALSAFCQDSLDPLDAEQVESSTIRLLASLPTIAAYAYRNSIGQPLPATHVASNSYVEDFLRLTFGAPGEEYDADPAVVRALDLLFILHADHEQNCSTSAVRLVGSAHADLFASIAAGVNALSGPLHGGANEAVLEMLEEIRGAGGDVAHFVSRVKNKQDGVKLMGFGHRVYKNYDPRAAIVKKAADEVLSALGKRDDLLDIAIELEGYALSDEYFVSRKLYPNVDFYTGLLYRAMGFPPNMFTVLFAIGRLPGWIAHWREGMNDPHTKIARPRQLYIGPTSRPYPRPASS